LAERDLSSMNFPAPLALAAAVLTLTAATPAFADEPIGQIKNETGQVSVQRNGAVATLKIGDHVFRSDTIVTAANSSVGVTFADNSLMSLGPSSRLRLEQFQFNKTTHQGLFDTALEKGTLAVKSGQIVRQTPGAMHVRTPAALLGVRGTQFLVRAGA
jgi:hypothetical protein